MSYFSSLFSSVAGLNLNGHPVSFSNLFIRFPETTLSDPPPPPTPIWEQPGPALPTPLPAYEERVDATRALFNDSSIGRFRPSEATLVGDAAADTLIAGAGRQLLLGFGGDDTLTSGAGADMIYGGAGDDVILGLGGRDAYFGWLGRDTLDLSGDAPGATVLLDNGRAWNGAGDIADLSGIEIVIGTEGRDRIRGDSSGVEIHGGGGGDLISGGVRPDELHGDGGDDTIRSSHGDDRVFGGDGDDHVNGGGGQDHLEGGDGDDRLSGMNGEDDLYGGDGDDRLKGNGHDDRLFGEAGNDRLQGGPQADLLMGGVGDDHLVGHFGDDRIVGGEGLDRIRVGRGADTIVFEDGFGTDIVYDFDLTEDRLDFAGHAGVEGVADLTLSLTAAGALLIDTAGGERVVLKGVNFAALDADIFLFGG